jgi:uncharacterized membrane protein YeiH
MKVGAVKYDSAGLLLAVDLAGTFIFGIEGAAAAIRGNLDLLGLMVLAFSTAIAGRGSRSTDRRSSSGSHSHWR